MQSEQKGSMTSTEYEQLVAGLAHKLISPPHRDPSSKVGFGTENKITGDSGFPHQIDVSVCNSQRILLFECKCWKRHVDPEAILTLAARVIDIRNANNGREVTGRIVTTLGVSNGAQQLADYFKLGMDVVSSMAEYSIKI